MHYPWSRLHRTLSGILPCEARTFLVWHLSACQPRSFILLISKRVYFTTHLLVLSRRSFHKAATKKNVPWHILAPSAVACDMFLFRASAHPAERFLCHRAKFPMTQKEIAPSRPEVGAISLKIILFLISLSYSTPDAPEPAPGAASTSHPALFPASCLTGSDQLR